MPPPPAPNLAPESALERSLPGRGLHALLAALLAAAPIAAAGQPAAVPGPRVEVVRPAGEAEALEFRDPAGAVTRRLERSFHATKVSGRQHITELKIDPRTSYVLVTDSERAENDAETRQTTGKVWNVRNRITLYDRTGEAVLERELECAPVAVSESGTIACLEQPPEYWEGPPAPDQLSPRIDRILVLSRRGDTLGDIEEPPHSVQNVRLSPSGNWLAYAKELGGLRNQVVLRQLRTGRLVTTPPTEDRSLRAYRLVSNKGDLVDYDDEPSVRPDGRVVERRSNARVLFRAGRP